MQAKIESINEMLKCNSTLGGCVCIGNGNIMLNHMANDNIHLNYDGIKLLADNFIEILNET